MSDVEYLVCLEGAIEARNDEAPVRRSFRRMKTEEPDQPVVSEKPTRRIGPAKLPR